MQKPLLTQSKNINPKGSHRTIDREFVPKWHSDSKFRESVWDYALTQTGSPFQALRMLEDVTQWQKSAFPVDSIIFLLHRKYLLGSKISFLWLVKNEISSQLRQRLYDSYLMLLKLYENDSSSMMNHNLKFEKKNKKNLKSLKEELIEFLSKTLFLDYLSSKQYEVYKASLHTQQVLMTLGFGI